MVETLLRSDQRTETAGIGGSPRARTWTPAVACMGVSLVVAPMTALHTALGDLAAATCATQTRLTWIVDGYTHALACLLLPARSRRGPLRPAAGRAPHRFGGVRTRLGHAGGITQPGADHHGPRGAGGWCRL
jgi:hypothetical protein